MRFITHFISFMLLAVTASQAASVIPSSRQLVEIHFEGVVDPSYTDHLGDEHGVFAPLANSDTSVKGVFRYLASPNLDYMHDVYDDILFSAGDIPVRVSEHTFMPGHPDYSHFFEFEIQLGDLSLNDGDILTTDPYDRVGAYALTDGQSYQHANLLFLATNATNPLLEGEFDFFLGLETDNLGLSSSLFDPSLLDNPIPPTSFPNNGNATGSLNLIDISMAGNQTSVIGFTVNEIWSGDNRPSAAVPSSGNTATLFGIAILCFGLIHRMHKAVNEREA